MIDLRRLPAVISSEQAKALHEQFFKTFPKLARFVAKQDKDTNDWIPWHESGQPTRRLLGSTVPCDMWTGPCSCSAWHKEGV